MTYRGMADRDGIIACEFQVNGTPFLCRNGGRPDPNNPDDVRIRRAEPYPCNRCRPIIREYQRRAREAGYS